MTKILYTKESKSRFKKGIKNLNRNIMYLVIINRKVDTNEAI